MKVRTSVLRGFALLALSSLTFAACDEKVQAPVTPPPAPVVTVTPQTVNLQVGQTTTLVATVANTTNQQVTWQSANTSVATVNANGQITAVAPGTAVITATSAADPNARAAAAVVVTAPPPAPAPTIQLVPPTATVQAGQTVQLVAIVGNTTNQTVTYTTSDATIATVSASGLVTTLRAGTAVITARTAATPQAAATSVITVTAAPAPTPVTITIAPTQASVTVGQTQQFTANVQGSTNTAVIYRSESPNVATINQSTGLATAVAPGTATITAMAAADTTRRVTATLTVAAAPPVTQPAISIQSVTIVGGGAATPGQTLPGNTSLNVVVNVSAGSEARIGRVEVRLGETAACQQTFSPPLAATQGVQSISCVVNTTQLNAQGQPLFPNGTYTLSARAFNEAGTQVAQAQWGALVLNNADRLNLSVRTEGVRGPGSAFSGGVLWYEGNVIVEARPVIFSPGGAAVGSANFCVQAQDGPVTAQACRDAELVGDVWRATFPKNRTPTAATNPGVQGITTTGLQVSGTSVYSSGAQGPQVAQGTVGLPLDNVGPTADMNAVTGRWFGNQTFRWSTAATATAGSDTLVFNVADVVPGVGLPTSGTVTFHALTGAQYSAIPATGRDSAAVEQFPAVTSAAALAENTSVTEYRLLAKVVDRLGNQTVLNLGTFGVDRTAPTATVAAASVPGNRAVAPSSVVVQFNNAQDDNSGLPPNLVELRITRTSSTSSTATIATSCYRGGDPSVITNYTTATNNPCRFEGYNSTSIQLPADNGYYRVEARVVDRAGNATATVDRLYLIDTGAPTANATGLNLASGMLSVSGTATDALDLNFYDTRLQFPGLTTGNGTAVPSWLPFSTQTEIGQFGLPLQRSATVSGSAPALVRIQTNYAETAGARTYVNRNGVGFGVFDQAMNFAQSGLTFASTPAAGDTVRHSTSFVVDATPNTTLCRTGTNPPCTDVAQTSTTLRAQATTAPTASQPFDVVYFYMIHSGGYAVLVGTSSSPGLTATQTERTWTWSTALTAAQIPDAASNQFFAVGVRNATNTGIISNNVQTITVQ